MQQWLEIQRILESSSASISFGMFHSFRYYSVCRYITSCDSVLGTILSIGCFYVYLMIHTVVLYIESTNILNINWILHTFWTFKTNRNDWVHIYSKWTSIILERNLKMDEQMDVIFFVSEIVKQDNMENFHQRVIPLYVPYLYCLWNGFYILLPCPWTW